MRHSSPGFNPLPGRRTLRQDLVHQILLALFGGRLKGGDRLVEEELAQKFEVSRTPVREALLELGVLGLIDMRANRGGVVREFGAKQLHELYSVRAVLEAEAARLATGKLPIGTLRAFEDRLLKLKETKVRNAAWLKSSLELDGELHDSIAILCGNAVLADEIRRYRRLVHAVRECLGDDANAQRRSIPQHLSLVLALRESDPDRAAEVMKQHVLDCAVVAAASLFANAVRSSGRGRGLMQEGQLG